jgi:S1-C subfamily serine protease
MLYQTIRPGEESEISIEELRSKEAPLAELPEPIEGQHPAVVRISASGSGNVTYHGSGTLIAVSEKNGVVLTNSHVVRGVRGPIRVRFPGGFVSTAEILGVDKTWDLAALLTARPAVEPVAIAEQVPELGDPLTIAGYGRGDYRQSSGWLIAYYAPGKDLPHEVLEVSTGARFGDSGGPIFNEKGRLAGVLFGSASQMTNGAHCGRLNVFLETIMASRDDFSWPPSD